MRKGIRGFALFIIILLIIVFIVPNVFNNREEKAFSNEERLERARESYQLHNLGDSITTSISDFYDRSKFAETFLGIHYRKMWHTSITLPVLDLAKYEGGLTYQKLGGGQQTTSADVNSKNGLAYTIRSVNKDQSKALPPVMQYSLARPMFRDQASALNPFGAVITAQLEDALNLLHTSPKMYFVPYDSSWHNDFLIHLAGRAVIIEEEPGDEWINKPTFGGAYKIVATDDMMEAWQQSSITIDNQNYLKCRLLDMLVSDWDRHGGQWAWAYIKTKAGNVAKPIPMDRDMAFYKFDDGLLNHLALAINHKFQSFNPEYDDVSGLMKNSKELDLKILSAMSQDDFLYQARQIKEQLTPTVIGRAFAIYPEEIYTEYGQKHIEIFNERLKNIELLAKTFHQVLNSDD